MASFGLVLWFELSKLHSRPKKALKVNGGPAAIGQVTYLLRPEIGEICHSGARFLVYLSYQSVLRAFTQLRVSARQRPGLTIGSNQNDLAVFGEAYAMRLIPR